VLPLVFVDVKLLMKVFREVDKARKGSISLEAFADAIGLKRDHDTARRVFALIDTDANGSIDFGEFVGQSVLFCDSPYSFCSLLSLVSFVHALSGNVNCQHQLHDTRCVRLHFSLWVPSRRRPDLCLCCAAPRFCLKCAIWTVTER
jgi:hypothetical protein